MTAATLMVQGTASHVGKSLLVAGLCRILRQDGVSVAPYKSWNMALNSCVTPGGGEIARAQAMQAEAAGVEPSVDMNPVLLKPSSLEAAQEVVLGQLRGTVVAGEFSAARSRELAAVMRAALDRLRACFDAVIIEGAGSPAEVNLRRGDLANMRVAAWAGAPVLLVADIDRGGALAAVVGTLELLPPRDRARVQGIVINRFRGRRELLESGLRYLERRTGVPVVGVVPYFHGLPLPEEDTLEPGGGAAAVAGCGGAGEAAAAGGAAVAPPSSRPLDLAVIFLPHLSNFTDFDPLAAEPGVRVRYVSVGQPLGSPDAVILPGTKNTVEDLRRLWASGLAAAVRALAARGVPVMGVCGGFQMLGQAVRDPLGLESAQPEVAGLGLLPVITELEPDKVTCRVRARARGGPGPLAPLAGQEIEGYEIHMGRTRAEAGVEPFAEVVWRDAADVRATGGAGVRAPDGAAPGPGDAAAPCLDGAVARDGLVAGTYLHGLFDAPGFRRAWLDGLRRLWGLPPVAAGGGEAARAARERGYALLARELRAALDMGAVYGLLGSVLRSGRPPQRSGWGVLQ